MATTPWYVTLLIGIAGILVGTFLRPLVDEWFANRRKTLHIIVTDTPITFHPPVEEMTVDWSGVAVDRIILTNFVIQNRTGRTLRNVRVGVAPKSGDADHNYEIVIEQLELAKMDVENDPHSVIFVFDYIEPKATIKGRMISDQTSDIAFEGLSDIELRRMDGRDADLAAYRTKIQASLGVMATSIGLGVAVSAISH